MKEFEKKNAVIVGISRDKPEAQKKWAEKLDLPFALLSDPEGKIHQKYGAWGEKNLYGKKSMGPLRSTIVVGEDGKVLNTFYKVKAAGHAAKVLAAIE